MQIFQCEQGTAEWFEARAGVITASMFKEVRKRLASGVNKGGYTKTARQYAFRLAFERITGLPLDDTYTTKYMERGTRLEEQARLVHEVRISDLIQEIGFVKTDCGRFGGSPDGLISTNGGSEYKCFISPETLEPILLEGDLSEVMDQIQGNMWITGRHWWHFGLYLPQLTGVGRELTLIRVERDDNYIEALKADLIAFDTLVEERKHEIETTNVDNVSNAFEGMGSEPLGAAREQQNTQPPAPETTPEEPVWSGYDKAQPQQQQQQTNYEIQF